VLIEMALAYYRDPLRYPRLADTRYPLPRGFGAMIPAFGSALMPRRIEATAEAMASSVEEVREAARFLVRQVLLAPGATPWRMLGFEAAASQRQVRQHYHLLIRLFHPDRQVAGAAVPSATRLDWDTDCAARLNAAYHRLLVNPGTPGDQEDGYGDLVENHQALSTLFVTDELRRYFQPQPPIVSDRPRLSWWQRLRWATRQLVLWVALLLVLGAMVFLLVSLVWSEGVSLRMPAQPSRPPPSATQGQSTPERPVFYVDFELYPGTPCSGSDGREWL